MRDVKENRASHSRIDPAEKDGFYRAANNGYITQRKGDKDACCDHDNTVSRCSQRVEERDIRVRRGGRCHSNIRERETMPQGESALGNKRAPRGLQTQTNGNVSNAHLAATWHPGQAWLGAGG
jgi:hypothetical protein